MIFQTRIDVPGRILQIGVDAAGIGYDPGIFPVFFGRTSFDLSTRFFIKQTVVNQSPFTIAILLVIILIPDFIAVTVSHFGQRIFGLGMIVEGVSYERRYEALNTYKNITIYDAF